MRLSIYWHLLMSEGWAPIASEQILLLKATGLYKLANSINLSIIGGEEQERRLFFLLGPERSVRLRSQYRNPLWYEFPALHALWMDSIGAHGIVLYFHLKGITAAGDTKREWRDILNDGVIRRWSEHVEALKSGNFDVSGQNYIYGKDDMPPHFSGNFWFARQEYIAKLPDPSLLDIKNRYEAEFWLCKNNPRVHALPFIQSKL